MQSLPMRKTLIDQAYTSILEAICDGHLKAGEKITQEDIAERLQVSRQPVTQALALLKSQGFVIDHGKRGVIVVPLDESFIRNVYDFRSAIEPLAVRLASPKFDSEHAAIAKNLIDKGMALVKRGNHKELVLLDMEFHIFLYKASGNSLITRSMEPTWYHLRRMMDRALRSQSSAERVWDEHAQIVAAMIRQDGEEAARLISAHLDNAYQRLGETYYGEAASPG